MKKNLSAVLLIILIVLVAFGLYVNMKRTEHFKGGGPKTTLDSCITSPGHRC